MTPSKSNYLAPALGFSHYGAWGVIPEPHENICVAFGAGPIRRYKVQLRSVPAFYSFPRLNWLIDLLTPVLISE